jgi:hypothetical protein
MKNDWGSECWGIYTGKGLAQTFSSQPFSRINTQTFSIPVILHTYPPMKMEQTEYSETLAYKIQTPGNYPQESIQQVFVCCWMNVLVKQLLVPLHNLEEWNT